MRHALYILLLLSLLSCQQDSIAPEKEAWTSCDVKAKLDYVGGFGLRYSVGMEDLGNVRIEALLSVETFENQYCEAAKVSIVVRSNTTDKIKHFTVVDSSLYNCLIRGDHAVLVQVDVYSLFDTVDEYLACNMEFHHNHNNLPR